MNVLGHFNYWVVIVLMMTGFYVIMARHNLVKKMLGLNVLQASIILMYVSMGKVSGGTAAILVRMPEGHGDGHGEGHAGVAGHGGEPHHGEPAVEVAREAAATGHEAATDHGHDAVHEVAALAQGGGHDAADLAHGAVEVLYSNPLPHVLMLTAIVVGVATTALGLALVVRIQEAYGTIEEDEIRRMDEEELA
jgi:multicomponent Na+:H+ antiporter subunit C